MIEDKIDKYLTENTTFLEDFNDDKKLDEFHLEVKKLKKIIDFKLDSPVCETCRFWDNYNSECNNETVLKLYTSAIEKVFPNERPSLFIRENGGFETERTDVCKHWKG